MKLLRHGLRFWITLTSLLSFVGGWIILAHAPKPVQAGPTSTASLPTLEPLPPLSAFGSDNESFQNQPLFDVQPRPRFGFPFFTTGGS